MGTTSTMQVGTTRCTGSRGLRNADAARAAGGGRGRRSRRGGGHHWMRAGRLVPAGAHHHADAVPARPGGDALRRRDGAAALAAAALRRVAGWSGIPGARAVPAAASAPDLVLTFGALPKGHAGADVGASALAGLAHLRVPVDGVMAPQARGLLSGAVTDWQAVGAPSSLPVRPILLDGLPLPKGLTLAASAQRAVTTDALLAALRSTPGSLAVAPMEAADWTVRNLGIDGVYPAQGRGGSNGADLPPFRLRLGASKALVDHGLDVRALARSLAPALAAAAPAVDMVVTGDIILGRGVNDKMVAYNDYLYPYRKVRDEFLLADWCVANLECTISDLVPIPTDPDRSLHVHLHRAQKGSGRPGLRGHPDGVAGE
jgi:Bacterial capsule synthesis protein PGA_cap